MRTQRLLLACIVFATLAALAGSLYAWPGRANGTPPPTVTVIIDHWGGTTPTAAPQASQPPAAYLRSAEGRDVRGGLGSYCWGGLCADTFAPISNADPFFLVIDQGYSIRFDGEAPASTMEQWIAVGASTGHLVAGGRSWPDVAPAGGLAKPTEPGLYLLVVQAYWPDGRDASYAFSVQLP